MILSTVVLNSVQGIFLSRREGSGKWLVGNVSIIFFDVNRTSLIYTSDSQGPPNLLRSTPQQKTIPGLASPHLLLATRY